jgi:hypothetical protein
VNTSVLSVNILENPHAPPWHKKGPNSDQIQISPFK